MNRQPSAAPAARSWSILAAVAICAACSSLRPTAETDGPSSDAPAKAFVIEEEDQLLGGPAALGRIGDVRIENGLVAFVVTAVDHQIGFAVGGGHVIDAAPIRSGDYLGQVRPQFGSFPRQARYERLTVLEREGAAVVRVAGRESHDREVEVTTEYELRDGAPLLQIRTTLVNRSRTRIPERPLGDAIQWGAARRFVPGRGWLLPSRTGVRFLTAIAPGASYAYGAREAWHGGSHHEAWSDTVIRRAALPPGKRVTYRRFLAVVPGASAPAAAKVALAYRGERTGTAVVTLSIPSRPDLRDREEDRPGVFVRIEDAEGRPVSYFEASLGAPVRVPLRRGEYAARVVGPRQSSPPVRFEVFHRHEPVDVTLEVSERGGIDCDVGMPARIVVEGRHGTPDPDLGPWMLAAGSGNVVYTTGRVDIPVPPGRYLLTASRGPEYEIATAEVEVEPGAARPAIELTLRRTVDTTGYIAADLHQHVVHSTDSGTTIRDRVIASAGEGVELVVSSDHDFLTDFAPAIEQAGLSRHLRSIVGDEITLDTSRWPAGHFNVFPLTVDANAPNGGALDPRDMPPAEIFARLLADDVPRVVQVNHPRSRKNGFFARARLDPRTGTGNGLWDPGFDSVEVWNGRGVEQCFEVFADLWPFWTRGIPYTATGSSDTHRLLGQEPGNPRTYLRVPTDDPAVVTEADIVSALRRTHDAVVTNGPFLLLEVEGTSIGGLATLPGGRGRARIEVRAASWLEVTTLQVIQSGEPLVEGEEIPRTPGEPLRHVREIDLELERDGWIQVLVRGDSPNPLGAAVGGDDPAFAFTNPVWLDVDGNGRYDPPSRP